MNNNLKQNLLKQHNDRFQNKMKETLSKLTQEINSYDKETINFYSLNIGYYNNLISEKNFFVLNGNPQIKELTQINDKQNNNNSIPPIRIIYAILGLKHSFDKSIIDIKRLKSKIWIKYRNFLIEYFHLSNIENTDLEDIYNLETLEIEDVLCLLNMCLDYWCGNLIILNEKNEYYMKNNGFNIID
jgi:hypothetical protein